MKNIKKIMIFALILMPFLLFLSEKILVWNGENYARNMCNNIGPLIVYDRNIWNSYSNEIRSINESNFSENRKLNEKIRIKYNIKIKGKKIYISPLLVTATYSRIELTKNNKIIAELNYYKATNVSPIFEIMFLFHPDSKFSCIEIRNYNYPEFI